MVIRDYSSDKTDISEEFLQHSVSGLIGEGKDDFYIFQIIGIGSALSCTVLICLIS